MNAQSWPFQFSNPMPVILSLLISALILPSLLLFSTCISHTASPTQKKKKKKRCTSVNLKLYCKYFQSSIGL